MSVNLGLQASTNFAQAKTFSYVTGTTPIGGSTNPTDLNQEVIAEEVLKTIASLNKNQASVDPLDKDPLDNIIRDEVVTLLNYRKLSKSTVQNAFENLNNGQDPDTVMSAEENIILLSQAKDLEYITESQYLNISSSPSVFWNTYPDAYKKVLEFQLSLPNNIPTIDELKVAGIVNFILTTVRDNPEVVIDENLVRKYTENYINTVLLSSEFIGYENAQKIYADPKYLMQILDKTTLKYFLYRVKPYLNFITDDKINTIMEWLPSQYLNIETVFSTTQVRLMIDKELDIKNLILKTLTLDEVQKTFNDLAIKFKADFTAAFTNEKLMELIQITINAMFPPLSIKEIYQNIATTLNTTIDDTKIQAIEDYLTNY